MNVQGNRYGSSWDYRNLNADSGPPQPPPIDPTRSGSDYGIQYDLGYIDSGEYKYPVPIPMKCGDGPVWWTPPSWFSLFHSGGGPLNTNFKDAPVCDADKCDGGTEDGKSCTKNDDCPKTQILRLL